MKATVSLDSLWQFILTLSPGNRDWLFEKLKQDCAGKRGRGGTFLSMAGV